MSKRNNQRIIRWHNVQGYLSTLQFQRCGQPLSARDRTVWVESTILMLQCWYDLFDSVDLSSRSIRPWCENFAHTDVDRVAYLLKSADSCLLQRYVDEDGSKLDFREFKTSLEGKFGKREINLIKPLWDPIRLFLQTGSIELYRDLHQAFAFTSRVTLRDIDGQEEVVRLLLRDASLPSPNKETALSINAILREWMVGFKVTHFPRHGGGGVSVLGRVSPSRKYADLGSDTLLRYVIRKYAPWNLEQVIPDDCINVEIDRTAELRLVPKTALTKRTICMEPTALQYFQQAVRRSLYAFIAANHRDKIDLKDQSRNARMAHDGSISGCYATIDLSAASDSVTWDLARIAFRGTSLLPWMYATKSRAILVSKGKTFKPRMFFPY